MRVLLTIAFTYYIFNAFTQVKGTLKDARDGKAYNTIEIGNQVWMAENLNVDRFRNGDAIKEITSNEEWVQAGNNGTPAWCYFVNDPASGSAIGKLYNWHAVNDPRGLAPEGWHIPSKEECKILVNQLGGNSVAGIKMKNTKDWYGGGLNTSGFNAAPSGRRGKSGDFSPDGIYFFWWTSTESMNKKGANYCYLQDENDTLKMELIYKERGFSVRCMKEKVDAKNDPLLKQALEAATEHNEKIQNGTIKPISKDAFNNNKNSGPPANLKSVVIGAQTWTSENLNVSTFRNGDPIPEVRSTEEWNKAGDNKQPAWCYYDNDPSNGAKYGKLYNWHAVNDPRGLAPNGWHVPSKEEWHLLENYLGKNIAGKKLKTTSGWADYQEKLTCDNCSYWTEDQKKNNPCTKCKNTREILGDKISTNGTNEFGFYAFPDGKRPSNGYFYFFGSDEKTFWTRSRSTELENHASSVSFVRDYLFFWNENLGTGTSIRLIKD